MSLSTAYRCDSCGSSAEGKPRRADEVIGDRPNGWIHVKAYEASTTVEADYCEKCNPKVRDVRFLRERNERDGRKLT